MISQMQQQIQAAADLLQLKLPGTSFERQVAVAASLSLDSARFMLAFFVACLCGLVLRYLPNVQARQTFAFVSGVALCGYVFGAGIIHGLASAVLNWAIVRFAPQHAALLGWLINFPHLAACHALSGDTWKRGDLDFTGGMMILVLRALSLCTNRTDGFNAGAAKPQQQQHGRDAHAQIADTKAQQQGGKDDSNGVQHVPADPPPGTHPEGKDQKQPQISAYLQERQLTAAPGLFDIAAFFFANGSLLGGPFFEYREWHDFLRRQGPFHEAFHVTDGQAPPNSLRPAAQKILLSFVYLGLFTSLVPHYPMQMVWGKGFAQASMLHRLFILWMVGLVFKLRFYFVWTLSDANLTLAGFGFNGWQDRSKGVARWDRQTNGWPLKLELCASTAKQMHVWNSKTGLFLRRYVYEKLMFGQQQPGTVALVGTYLFSGVWHGLEPTYTLMFLTGAMLTASSRVIHKLEKRIPPALAQSKPFDAVWTGTKILWTSLSMNYTCLAFHVYSISKVFEAWGRFYFAFHWIALGVLCLPALLPAKQKAKAKAN